MLKPLPYPNSERLLFITSTFPALGFDRFWVSLPEWAEFKERNRSFSAVGGYREGSVNLGSPERPRRVNSVIVTPELLDVLGVAPLRGRLFNEARRARRRGGRRHHRLHHLAERLRRRRRACSAGSFQIDGTPTRIVGIMPPGFDIHDERVEVFLPLTIDPTDVSRTSRGSHFLYLVGRLKDGVSPQQAQADLDTMIEQWRDAERQPAFARASTAGNNRGHLLQMHADEVRHGRRHRHRAVGAAGRGRFRAAHRLRQPGQPDPRARRIAAEGIRHPLGARRRPLAAAAPVPHRGRAARAGRRRARRGARLRRPARDAGRESRQHSARARDRARLESAAVHAWRSRSSRASSSAWRRCCTCASRSSRSR